MTLLQQFVGFVTNKNLFQPKDHLLIAVSGGVDSVVLCELCKQAQFCFTIAHCNFQLRGDESERDEHFVRALGEKYGARVLVKIFDTKKFADDQKLSVQVAARKLRYDWFNELLARESNTDQTQGSSPVGSRQSAVGSEEPQVGSRQSAVGSPEVPDSSLPTIDSRLTTHSRLPTADCLLPTANSLPTAHWLLTAHHANDSIETVLMNFFKGTGIAGMRGILPKQGRIIRPLLFARKQALVDFASENNLEYVEDSSNVSDKYTRNYFRNQLIPAVSKVFPNVEDNLANNLQRFAEIEQLYSQAIDLHKKKLLEIKGKEVHIPVLKLKKIVPLETVLYEIIKGYGFTAHQAKEVIDLIDSGPGKFVESSLYRVIQNRNWLIISPRNSSISETILISEGDRAIEFGSGLLELKELAASESQLSASPGMAYLDADGIRFPLLLRKRKQGDYFYPLGMEKKKKVNRFLSDLKVSLPEKENTWVLEMDKKVIWVVGKRIDNRFRVTTKTSKVLVISFTSGVRKHQKGSA